VLSATQPVLVNCRRSLSLSLSLSLFLTHLQVSWVQRQQHTGQGDSGTARAMNIAMVIDGALLVVYMCVYMRFFVCDQNLRCQC
jgi:hypothetical protein